ncbi:MAG: capsule assembly Wzi family protein [Gammaproteobacteria bacterium]|jgi:hypothetical protein
MQQGLRILVGIAVAGGLLWGGISQAAAPADPVWIGAGNLAARHDVEILVDAGVLSTPMDAWPLPWDALRADLQAVDRERLSPLQRAAWRRLMAALPTSGGCRAPSPEGALVSRGTAAPLGWFAGAPRMRQGYVAGAGGRCGPFFYRARLSHVEHPDDSDRRQNRLDGSYLGAVAGNWLVTAGEEPRWWGSAWGGSMVLGLNARPFPAIGLRRVRATPFRSHWLSWLGPWRLDACLGQLESNRYVPNTRMLGLRFSFRPLPHLQIGLYRTAEWGGDGKDSSPRQLVRIMMGNNGKGPSVAGNQVAGVDVRWSWASDAVSWAAYGSAGFEDEIHHIPKKDFPVFGLEAAWQDRAWSRRAFVEYSDTTAGWPFHGGPSRNYTYENFQYRSGYRYYGQTIGFPSDNDSRLLTTGLMQVDTDGRQLTLLARAGVLNADGSNAPFPGGNPIAPERTRLLDAEAGWAMPLGPGQLTLGAAAVLREPAGLPRDARLTGWLGWSAAFP